MLLIHLENVFESTLRSHIAFFRRQTASRNSISTCETIASARHTTGMSIVCPLPTMDQRDTVHSHSNQTICLSLFRCFSTELGSIHRNLAGSITGQGTNMVSIRGISPEWGGMARCGIITHTTRIQYTATVQLLLHIVTALLVLVPHSTSMMHTITGATAGITVVP
jgi:hypothetical protein